jgi:DNA invertase Pin-like site-specific DNA recombinase
MRDYVRARGWEVAEYVDTAADGDLAHRKAWARLLEDAARRRIDRVLVWKLDRAFRSTLHALATLRVAAVVLLASVARRPAHEGRRPRPGGERLSQADWFDWDR